MEFTLLAAAAIGVASLYVMLWWEAKRGNAADCTRDLWEVALAAIIAGVFVGRLAAMIIDGVNPLANPGDILIVRAGVATGWASAAALLTVVWLARDELRPVADGLAAAALAGLAGWHAGCLPREACLGTPTDLPWAMSQPGSSVGRHPVELYAALGFALAAIALAWWRKVSPPPAGVAAFAALAVAGGVRLVTEPIRPALSPGPVWWYVAGVAVGVAGLGWSYRQVRRRPGAPG